MVVQHRRWREVLEAGEASEEVPDGAGEVAVVKGQHLQLLHGVGECKWERPPSVAIAGGNEARVVAERDLEEVSDAIEEVGWDGVEVVVVEEGVLERCLAVEGQERAQEAVPLAIMSPFATAPSVLAEKVNHKWVSAVILRWDEFGGSILRTISRGQSRKQCPQKWGSSNET